MAEPSIIGFITNAGPVVKAVMFLLLVISLVSWTIILERLTVLKQHIQQNHQFNRLLAIEKYPAELYQAVTEKKQLAQGLNRIFQSGYRAFQRNKIQRNTLTEMQQSAIERDMRIASNRELLKLEKHLAFLATVGSTSPYIGLFGTVWGIMSSFSTLGQVQQATLALVAPGIAEALVATAMGLFAAIPAVIAYNRFSNHIDSLSQDYSIFQEELLSLFMARGQTND